MVGGGCNVFFLTNHTDSYIKKITGQVCFIPTKTKIAQKLSTLPVACFVTLLVAPVSVIQNESDFSILADGLISPSTLHASAPHEFGILLMISSTILAFDFFISL
jgi:hypothetical protein